VAFADARGGGFDLGAVGDVAGLGLRAELLRYTLQALGSPREQDALPAAGDQEAGRGRSDPARPSGYDGDANRRRVVRLIPTVSSIGSA
jgi:hypothetical protein